MLRNGANFDLKMLAHCRMCCEPLLYIYDTSLRDFCHECLCEMSVESAMNIIGKKKPRGRPKKK